MSSAKQSQPFPFLSLPREIRLTVYEHLPIETKHYVREDHDTAAKVTLVIKSIGGISILATCRTVHREALRILGPKLETLKQPIRLITEPICRDKGYLIRLLTSIIFGTEPDILAESEGMSQLPRNIQVYISSFVTRYYGEHAAAASAAQNHEHGASTPFMSAPSIELVILGDPPAPMSLAIFMIGLVSCVHGQSDKPKGPLNLRMRVVKDENVESLGQWNDLITSIWTVSGRMYADFRKVNDIGEEEWKEVWEES